MTNNMTNLNDYDKVSINDNENDALANMTNLNDYDKVSINDNENDALANMTNLNDYDKVSINDNENDALANMTNLNDYDKVSINDNENDALANMTNLNDYDKVSINDNENDALANMTNLNDYDKVSINDNENDALANMTNVNDYDKVSINDNENEALAVDTHERKLLLRQLFVSSGVWVSFFMLGLCVGAPTVFIPQLRRENPSEPIGDEMASWLTSVFDFSAIPWVIVISIFTKLKGRKICMLIAFANSFVAFIIFFCSKSVLQILISEIMQGLFSATQSVITMAVLSEYTSPKYRGLFLALKSASMFWGIWVSNAIGTYFHWKKIGLLGIICSLYTTLSIILWPESPYWLASKGRYQECATSHRWLKGCDDEAKKELDNLLKYHKDLMEHQESKPLKENIFKFVYMTVHSKDFYKPNLIATLVGLLGVFSGKLVCTVYVIDILKKITSSESTAYAAMLILDGITVFSMYVGCILTKFMNRRTLLLSSSCIGILFLFVLSLYLYLIHIYVIEENAYISVSLLMCFSIAVSCGPETLSLAIVGELIPLKSRNFALCLIAIVAKVIIGIEIKLAPLIIKSVNLHGTFLLFGVSCSIITALLYKYLPETKDKTLQEISEKLLKVKKYKVNEAPNRLVISVDENL